jgi:hypothetical protein
MQFIAILIVAALWVKWGWILIAAVVVAWLVYRMVKEFRLAHTERLAGEAAEQARVDGFRARADQQHNWRMQGSPRGTYGEGQSFTAPS